MADESEWVEIGLACAHVCRTLEQGMNGKGLGDLSQSACDVINQLTMWVEPATHRFDSSLTCTLYRRTVAEVQTNVVEWHERNTISRLLHTKSERELIATWKSDLDRALHFFNVRSDSAHV